MTAEYDLTDVIFPHKSLEGVNGNVFSVIGFVSKALRRAGNSKEIIERYQREVSAGDYNLALRVSMAYLGMFDSDYDEED